MPVLIHAAKQDPLSWDSHDQTAMMRGELGFFDIAGAKNPRVKMIILNDSGHFPYREHPEMFAADLTQFIEFWRNNRTAKQADGRPQILLSSLSWTLRTLSSSV